MTPVKYLFDDVYGQSLIHRTCPVQLSAKNEV